MTKVSKTLQEILNEYRFVVIDTSVVSVKGNSAQKEQYKKNFISTVRSHPERVFMPVSILHEIYRYDQKIQQRARLTGYNPGIYRSIYQSFFEYFKEEADIMEIIDASKENPFADVKIVAMAFTLATNENKIAFLSSDRILNELVYKTTIITNEECCRKQFPYSILGEITPYSFVQRVGLFIPYVLEKEGKTFSQLVP